MPELEPKGSLWRHAVHEASHAVAALAVGWEVTEILP